MAKRDVRPLFYERFVMDVQGTSKTHKRVRILVWEGDADRFMLPAVRFSWWLHGDANDAGLVDVEIEEHGTSKARQATKLALRILDKVDGYGLSPSDLQALLTKLKATKVVRDERFSQESIPEGTHLPA